MNVFDFDNTIYDGDSTLDFWFFAVRRQPACLKVFPVQVLSALGYGLGLLSKESFKQTFYRFLGRVDDVEGLVKEFWDRSLEKMNVDVLSYAREGDLVVSASPRFLLELPCSIFGFNLIASEVDVYTGRLEGPNCYGSDKVRRIKEEGFPTEFEMGFSDSMSDKPMLSLAREPYFVRRRRIAPAQID